MLDKLETQRKSGNEPFHSQGQKLGFDLLSFWQWVDSDLVSNACRGRLAEYLVAQALGLASRTIRGEWDAFDLQLPSGIKVEVKSAAYIQSWSQRDYSSIIFQVPRTRAWDAETNLQRKESQRQADIYIFALLSHRDKATIEPLDVSQWKFYALPTGVLNARTRSQHSITLRSLEKLCRAITYFELAETVEQIGEALASNRA